MTKLIDVFLNRFVADALFVMLLVRVPSHEADVSVT